MFNDEWTRQYKWNSRFLRCCPRTDKGMTSDGSFVSFQKTAVAVLASLAVFKKNAVAVVMRLCYN